MKYVCERKRATRETQGKGLGQGHGLTGAGEPPPCKKHGGFGERLRRWLAVRNAAGVLCYAYHLAIGFAGAVHLPGFQPFFSVSLSFVLCLFIFLFLRFALHFLLVLLV